MAAWLDVSVVKSWPVSEREQKERDILFYIYAYMYMYVYMHIYMSVFMYV